MVRTVSIVQCCDCPEYPCQGCCLPCSDGDGRSAAPIASGTMDKQTAIEDAGRVWRNTVAEIPDLKKRIRAEAEARIEAETLARKKEAARAIHAARDAGATKAALRQVTTKDHWNFEGYIDLGERLAAEDG